MAFMAAEISRLKINGKGDCDDSEELLLQLHERDKLIEQLRLEIVEKGRIFTGADNWNRLCSKDKAALVENVTEMRKSDGSARGNDAFKKIVGLEQTIAERDRDLKSAKEANEQLAFHIFGQDAKIAEIPKLEK